MATYLKIHGPFEITFQLNGSAKHIGDADVDKFLKSLDSEGIAEKKGCYIFAIHAALGFTPWYVGKTTISMREECMEDHKLKHYNNLLFGPPGGRPPKGTPVMFFVAPDKDLRMVPSHVCDEIETLLIATAFRKNNDILNVYKTKGSEWSIDGVVNSGKGKPAKEAVLFRKMLGIYKSLKIGSGKANVESVLMDAEAGDVDETESVIADHPGTHSGEELNPESIAKLADVDGRKDEYEENP